MVNKSLTLEEKERMKREGNEGGEEALDGRKTIELLTDDNGSSSWADPWRSEEKEKRI